MPMPASSKPLGSGLDFSHIHYGDKAQRFETYSKAAREILSEKLQLFAEINGLVKVTLAEGDLSDAPIWIDARSSPVKVLDSAPADGSEFLIEFVVSPEAIDDLYSGRKDGQSVAFTPGTLGRTPMSKFPLANRFTDLITPNPPGTPVLASELNLDELPKPTEDIDQVKRDLRKWGYGMLKNALSPEQVAILKKASQEQAAAERNAGVATFDGGPNKPNQRVWNLFNKGEEFVDLMDHPLIDEVVPWYLGCDDPLLWSYSVNIARPGGIPQVLHWDQGIMAHGREKAVALNISWLLIDFTEKNGGTRIFPGSHNVNVRPWNLFSSDGSVGCEAPAGTALIFEGRLWHGTGKNTEAGGERPCVLSLFCNNAVRPKENAFVGLGWEAEERLSERHKSLIAFRTGLFGTGGAMGEARTGVLVHRPRGDEHKPFGKVRERHDDDEVARLLATGEHANTAATRIREAGGIDVAAVKTAAK